VGMPYLMQPACQTSAHENKRFSWVMAFENSNTMMAAFEDLNKARRMCGA
jgi:hypothetical protein